MTDEYLSICTDCKHSKAVKYADVLDDIYCSKKHEIDLSTIIKECEDYESY
ncbi:hypothetical protein [Methanobrevibacter sp.]